MPFSDVILPLPHPFLSRYKLSVERECAYKKIRGPVGSKSAR
jgi:hypothetical protein